MYGHTEHQATYALCDERRCQRVQPRRRQLRPLAVNQEHTQRFAAGFRKSKNLEKTIAGVLASLTRLGHVSTRDGKTFELRRAA